jgi:hypothetical protein
LDWLATLEQQRRELQRDCVADLDDDDDYSPDDHDTGDHHDDYSPDDHDTGDHHDDYSPDDHHAGHDHDPRVDNHYTTAGDGSFLDTAGGRELAQRR